MCIAGTTKTQERLPPKYRIDFLDFWIDFLEMISHTVFYFVFLCTGCVLYCAQQSQSDKAIACIPCEAGRASVVVAQPTACPLCTKGYFQPITSQTSCTKCGLTGLHLNKQFQNQEGQIKCLNCDSLDKLSDGTSNVANTAVANGGKTDCDKCATVSGTTHAFLNNNGKCAICGKFFTHPNTMQQTRQRKRWRSRAAYFYQFSCVDVNFSNSIMFF